MVTIFPPNYRSWDRGYHGDCAVVNNGFNWMSNVEVDWSKRRLDRYASEPSSGKMGRDRVMIGRAVERPSGRVAKWANGQTTEWTNK